MPASQKAARATLANWRDYRGGQPFMAAGDAPDRCIALLGNARAILSMLSAACEDAGALLGKGEESAFDGIPGMAGALAGVSDLIALADFMLEDGE